MNILVPNTEYLDVVKKMHEARRWARKLLESVTEWRNRALDYATEAGKLKKENDELQRKIRFLQDVNVIHVQTVAKLVSDNDKIVDEKDLAIQMLDRALITAHKEIQMLRGELSKSNTELYTMRMGSTDLIDDGFGNYFPKYCEYCGAPNMIVRPGKMRCSNECFREPKEL